MMALLDVAPSDGARRDEWHEVRRSVMSFVPSRDPVCGSTPIASTQAERSASE